MRVSSKRYVFVYSKVEDQRGFMILNQGQGEGEGRGVSERERRECIGITRETLDHVFKNEKIIALKKENVRTISNFDDDGCDQGEGDLMCMHVYVSIYVYSHIHIHVLLCMHIIHAQI